MRLATSSEFSCNTLLLHLTSWIPATDITHFHDVVVSSALTVNYPFHCFRTEKMITLTRSKSNTLFLLLNSLSPPLHIAWFTVWPRSSHHKSKGFLNKRKKIRFLKHIQKRNTTGNRIFTSGFFFHSIALGAIFVCHSEKLVNSSLINHTTPQYYTSPILV